MDDLLKKLTTCLTARGMPARLLKIRMSHSVEAERDNDRDHRLFCFTKGPLPPKIYFSKNLEQLPVENQIGILLHEISHLIHGPDEAMADLGVSEALPDIGYSYIKRVDYRDAYIGEPRTASNIESVSKEFAQEVLNA